MSFMNTLTKPQYRTKLRRIGKWAAFFYFLFLVGFLCIPLPLRGRLHVVTIRPYVNVFNSRSNVVPIMESCANIFLFMPLGIILYFFLCRPQRKPLSIIMVSTVIGLLFSLLILISCIGFGSFFHNQLLFLCQYYNLLSYAL